MKARGFNAEAIQHEGKVAWRAKGCSATNPYATLTNPYATRLQRASWKQGWEEERIADYAQRLRKVPQEAEEKS